MKSKRTVLFYNERIRKALWVTETHLFESVSSKQFDVMSATIEMINEATDQDLADDLIEAVRLTCIMEGSKI